MRSARTVKLPSDGACPATTADLRRQHVRTHRAVRGRERSWDEFAAGIGKTLRNGGRGTPLETASDAIARMMLLVDREGNRGANLILCETEDDLRRVDAALEEITPAGGRGPRTSMEMFEVLLDEVPGA